MSTSQRCLQVIFNYILFSNWTAFVGHVRVHISVLVVINRYRISSIIRQSLINGRGVAQYPCNNNHTCYGDKERSVHFNTTVTKLQAVKVAQKTSKEAAAMSVKNSQLTVSTATNTTNTP